MKDPLEYKTVAYIGKGFVGLTPPPPEMYDWYDTCAN